MRPIPYLIVTLTILITCILLVSILAPKPHGAFIAALLALLIPWAALYLRDYIPRTSRPVELRTLLRRLAWGRKRSA